MTALISGSMAFDNIMVFPDRFKNHILPDKVHMLNVSFLVPELRREYGGCAGNIAYNLKLLGGSGQIMATVGSDFAPYRAWMEQNGMDTRHIRELADSYTAQAYITTDMDDNQITAFHPGAMSASHANAVADANGITLGIVSPAGKEGMVAHAAQFQAADIPFIFDPGQGLPMYSGEELIDLMQQADWLASNDYEAQLIEDKTGKTPQQWLDELGLKAVITTLGGDGARILTAQGTETIPSAKATVLKDPTGCGDAFRAGLLYGLMNGLDWASTGRIASLLGAIKIEHHGTQNHRFDRAEFAARYMAEFGQSCPV